MFADKNLKLALIAGLILILALFVLAVGLAYRAGYAAAMADLESLTAISPLAGTATSASTAVHFPTATIPPDTPASTDNPPTRTPAPTDRPPAAAPVGGGAADVPPAPSSTPTTTPTEEYLGEVQATIDAPTYLNGGRWAEVMVTVTNVSVASGVSTGYTYVHPNPDGGTQYVTIFSAIHDEVPLASLDADAPLWIGWVRFTDGEHFYFPAGCLYVETVEAEGWEPIGPEDGFKWEVHWTGGFYDCGNSTHKIPAQPKLMPGQSATIPIYVYIQHPRLWEDKAWGPPARRISYIALEVRDGQGRSLGTVAEYGFP
jgi:hypothetical protein